MKRVLMVSKFFLKDHIRAGEETLFLEKIDYCLGDSGTRLGLETLYGKKVWSKGHTIRSGDRWNAGDIAIIKIWTGKPYCSPQQVIREVEVKKVFTFDIMKETKNVYINDIIRSELFVHRNDGLSYNDFVSWFGLDKKNFKGFTGQIICWDQSINY